MGQSGLRFLGYVLMSLGRYDEAKAVYTHANELSPDPDAWDGALGDILLWQGHPHEALEKYATRDDGPFKLLRLSQVYFTLGRKAESDAALKQVESKYSDDLPFQIAEIHAWRGNNDLAFKWLNRALDLRDAYLGDVKLSQEISLLKDDPRYSEFLKRMNFPNGS